MQFAAFMVHKALYVSAMNDLVPHEARPPSDPLMTASTDGEGTRPSYASVPTWREAERLAALDRYAILDTGRETAFDDVAALAADILEAPIAVVNLIAADRQWFKAEVGIGTDTLPLDVSICRHAILQPGVFVVPDLTRDARFDGNPLVHVADGLRFYAGALLETPDGLPLGTVCVLDTKPRPQGLSERQTRALKVLASQTMARLELRRSEAIAKAERARAERRSRRLSLLSQASSLLLATSDPARAVRELFALVAEGFRLDVGFHYRCGGGALQLVAAAGLTPAQEDAAARIEFGQSVCGIVAATREPTHVTGIQASDDPQVQFLKRLGLDTYFSAPVLSGGDLLGTLSFGRKDVAFSAGELEALRTLVAQLATALERRRAEADRLASAAELRLVADALPLLVAFIDPSESYRFANEAYREWFGTSPQDVIGRTVRELAGEAGYAVRRPFIREALAGEPVRFDLPWPRLDGARRIADIRYTPRRTPQGEVDGFYVFVQDVTAQRDAEGLLAAENLTLSREVMARTAERDRLWETTNDLMGMAGFDGYLKTVNPAWAVLLGWSEDELLGRPFVDIVASADHMAMADVVRRLSAGEAVTSFAYHLLAKDGALRTIMWTAVPEPEKALFYVIGRDLTEQVKMEEALRQSQKMEAVGQLTGGLAHDFNNLLAGITGSLELMGARLSQGRVNELEKYMIAAQGAAKRAAALTHRLLAFSRRQTLDPKPTNINALVSGMTDLIQRTVGPAIQVETVQASGLWPTLVDPPQLENALLNLCINARDAMAEGGRITIETANKWLDRQAAAKQDVPEGQYLSLCVTDTGVGMSPDLVSKIFDPFFTTKPIGQGTGLGLSMIYGFAKQSGGQVRVYSEVGEGTTMCIYLPRYYGEVDAHPAELAAARAAAAEDGETVLVVDDEPTVRMLVTDVLEDLGYRAIEAADSLSGLKVLRSDVRIDLLITDVGLPGGMNGRQMADAGREARPDLKVLFITGYAENAVLNNGHLSANMQVMTKPFAVKDLVSRIREIIDSSKI